MNEKEDGFMRPFPPSHRIPQSLRTTTAAGWCDLSCMDALYMPRQFIKRKICAFSWYICGKIAWKEVYWALECFWTLAAVACVGRDEVSVYSSRPMNLDDKSRKVFMSWHTQSQMKNWDNLIILVKLLSWTCTHYTRRYELNILAEDHQLPYWKILFGLFLYIGNPCEAPLVFEEGAVGRIRAFCCGSKEDLRIYAKGIVRKYRLESWENSWKRLVFPLKCQFIWMMWWINYCVVPS